MKIYLTDSSNRQYVIDSGSIEYLFHSIPNPKCENFYVTIGFHRCEQFIEFNSIDEMKKAFDLIFNACDFS